MMKNRVTGGLWKLTKVLNQILLFVFLCYAFCHIIDEIVPKSDYCEYPEGLPVFGEEGELGNSVGSNPYLVEYHTSEANTYLFELKRDSVPRQDGSSDRASLKFCREEDRYQAVNLLFVEKGKQPKKLLVQDAYIVDMNIHSKRYKGSLEAFFEKNVYSVIDTDTNGDGILTRADRTDLYLSNKDGSGLELLVPDYDSYRVVDSQEVLVTQFVEGKKVFWLYSGESGSLEKIDLGDFEGV